MKIKKIGKIVGGQDGAIYGAELFRFNEKGDCWVYDLTKITSDNACELQPIAKFTLDLADVIAPHGNSVCFGADFYDSNDDYPLLYSNVYNNDGGDGELMGACLVYRITRKNNVFSTKLLQIIKIGFCEDANLWKASTHKHGVRPYGNFVIDKKTRSYWAFVMRNETLGTRYFRFNLPLVSDGEAYTLPNVKKVVLGVSDIKEYIDCDYHRYVQGATLFNDKIYSTEGFSDDAINHPSIRIIDVINKKEQYFDITKLNYTVEPEFIDFYGDDCIYSDFNGNLYVIEF